MIHFPKTVLKVNQASFAYGSRPALAGLSFELKAGEILGLLGPNGAGKTTLIKCISGRQALASGSIESSFGGRWSDQIGIVPQEIAIYPDLTVRQNLTAFGRLQGLAARQLRLRIEEALAWANLESRAKFLAQTLSGGMQRRLNIACSVLHRPRILLLDEPTVGVDPQSRESIYGMLETLVAEGTAILLTTHHLEEAQNRCDRIAIIDKGKLVDSGTFEELLKRTIGNSQQLTVSFAEPAEQVPPPLRLAPSRLEAVGVLGNAAQELPRLLLQLEHYKVSITSFSVHEPTLQHLFLHLTGKELRE